MSIGVIIFTSPPYILKRRLQQIGSGLVMAQLIDKIVGCVSFLYAFICADFPLTVSKACIFL